MCRAELDLCGMPAWTMAGLAYGSRPFVVQCNPRGANSRNAMVAKGGDWLGGACVSWLCGETAWPPTRAAMGAIDLPLIALICVKVGEMDGRRQARRSWLGFWSLRTSRCKAAGRAAELRGILYQASLIGHLVLVTALPVQHIARSRPHVDTAGSYNRASPDLDFGGTTPTRISPPVPDIAA